MFIDQLQSSALEDCAAFYESDINLLLRSYDSSAVNETELLVGGREMRCLHWLFVTNSSKSCTHSLLLSAHKW